MRPATTIVLVLLLVAIFAAGLYQLFVQKSPISSTASTGLVRALLAR